MAEKGKYAKGAEQRKPAQIGDTKYNPPVHRFIDESKNTKGDGTKYRIGNVQENKKERSRMKMRDVNPDPEKVMYWT